MVRPLMMSTDYDILIAGGGPAGVSAGLTLAGLGVRCAVLEKTRLGDGILRIGEVENMPGYPGETDGAALAMRLEEQTAAAGLPVIPAAVETLFKENGRHVILAGGRRYTARAVILATGLIAHRLGVAGEDALAGKGVYTCVYCDYGAARGKTAVVAGGGDAGCKAALFLSRFAAKVYLVHKGDQTAPGKKERIAAASNIEVLHRATIRGLEGTDALAAVRVAEGGSWQTRSISAQALFVYIGGRPGLGYIHDYIRTDRKGFIVTDTSMATSLKGVFAVGAVRARAADQVILSLSDGVVAALAALEWLDGSPKSFT